MSPGRLHLTYGKKCQKLFMITMLDLIQIGVYLIQWCSDGSSALREDRLSRFDKKCDWLSSFGKKCDWLSVKKKAGPYLSFWYCPSLYGPSSRISYYFSLKV